MADPPKEPAEVKEYRRSLNELQTGIVDYVDALRVAAESRIAELTAELSGAQRHDTTAGRLIDAWVAEKGKQIPWAKAVQIVAIITKQSDDERDKLLHYGEENDNKCEMCGCSKGLRDKAESAERRATESDERGNEWHRKLVEQIGENTRLQSRIEAALAVPRPKGEFDTFASALKAHVECIAEIRAALEGK
jgi:hypothetical protein